jgi:Ulp1 protease family, C-terminal catalytic domain
MQYCAPNLDHLDIKDHYTCFDHAELVSIAKAFNRYIRKNNVCSSPNVCVPRRPIEITSSKKELWNNIYKHLSPICKYEYCWVDLDIVDEIKDKKLRDKIRYFTFKPKTTETHDAWLNTSDINYVLRQYEIFDRSFKFLGALPSDFYKVTRVDYHKVFDFAKIAIVFNLDAHDEPGSHWTAFFIDHHSKSIEYFDSAGKRPNKRIKQFIDKIWTKYLGNYRFKLNKVVHQRENSECGIYAIYYIIQRLLGFTFEDISSNVISDKQINKFRKHIFRPRL